jgi:RNA polymerase sigma-70 factor (ECF subfamily)
VDDLTLLTTLARDLDAGFEALALAYQRRLYGLALRLTTSPPDAEEIAQDTLVRAYRALATYPVERIEALALRPWLYQIAVNVWRNRVRKARLREVSLEGDDGAPAFEAAAPVETQPERQAESNERRQELGALVATLAPRYRVAVVLRHIYELTYPEIAETLEQPVGTVKANVHRGVRILREALLARPDTLGDERAPQTYTASARVMTGETQEFQQDIRHDVMPAEAARARPLAMVTRWEGARK